MPSVPAVRLNNGVQIPQLGFGVFQIKPEDTVEASIRPCASATGTSTPRRCTATRSEAIANSGIDPSDIFVTTKLNNNKHAFGDALAAVDQSLADLGLDRVDLFLIHWPLPTVSDYAATWRALERSIPRARHDPSDWHIQLGNIVFPKSVAPDRSLRTSRSSTSNFPLPNSA